MFPGSLNSEQGVAFCINCAPGTLFVAVSLRLHLCGLSSLEWNVRSWHLCLLHNISGLQFSKKVGMSFSQCVDYLCFSP